MSKQATTRRWTKAILIACGGVMVFFVAVYVWQTQRPTGYEKLSVPSPVDHKQPRKVPSAPRTMTPPAQTPIASAPAPTPASSPKTSPLFEPFEGVGWYPLWWFGGIPWVSYDKIAASPESTKPEQILNDIQTHSPRSFRVPLSAPLSPEAIKDLREIEARIWQSDWPQPTTEAYYGRNPDAIFTYYPQTRIAALTALLAAARGDTAEANARILTIFEQNARMNQISLGRDGETVVEFLFTLEAMGALSSDTLSRAIAILDDSTLTEEEFKDQRRAGIRIMTDACLDEMDSWPSTNNTFSCLLDGVPDNTLRRFMAPAVRKSYEQYAVAISDANPAAIDEAESELRNKITMMNRRHEPHLRKVFAVPTGRFDSFYVHDLFPLSAPSYPIKYLYQNSLQGIIAERFAAACLQYKMEHGEWPRHCDELVAHYLPPGFLAQTERDWIIMKPEPFEVCSPDGSKRTEALSLYFSKNGEFPSNARQLANFFQSADDEPFRALFETIRPQFMFASVRRCGQVEGHEIRLGSDGNFITTTKQGERLQTMLFVFPEGEAIEAMFSQLEEAK